MGNYEAEKAFKYKNLKTLSQIGKVKIQVELGLRAVNFYHQLKSVIKIIFKPPILQA